MITVRTIHQLLQVFRVFRENYLGGMPLHRSYHQAVRSVAQSHSVTYQTIGDGCRRRLRLNDINDLFELLSAWMKGDPQALKRQLNQNSESAAHPDIDRFFAESSSPALVRQKISSQGSSVNGFETVSFRLPERDARRLRALAELEGLSVSEIIARVVSTAVRDRMKVVAQELIGEPSGTSSTRST